MNDQTRCHCPVRARLRLGHEVGGRADHGADDVEFRAGHEQRLLHGLGAQQRERGLLVQKLELNGDVVGEQVRARHAAAAHFFHEAMDLYRRKQALAQCLGHEEFVQSFALTHYLNSITLTRLVPASTPYCSTLPKATMKRLLASS